MSPATEAAINARTCDMIIQLGAMLDGVKLARECTRLPGDSHEADALISLQHLEEAECAADTLAQLVADAQQSLARESEAARVAAGSLAGGAS